MALYKVLMGLHISLHDSTWLKCFKTSVELKLPIVLRVLWLLAASCKTLWALSWNCRYQLQAVIAVHFHGKAIISPVASLQTKLWLEPLLLQLHCALKQCIFSILTKRPHTVMGCHDTLFSNCWQFTVIACLLLCFYQSPLCVVH